MKVTHRKSKRNRGWSLVFAILFLLTFLLIMGGTQDQRLTTPLVNLLITTVDTVGDGDGKGNLRAVPQLGDVDVTRKERRSSSQHQQQRQSAPFRLKDNFLNASLFVSPEKIWEALIEEAAAAMKKTTAIGKAPGTAFEVGMHTATDCIRAARLGLEAHCVEPSPQSSARIRKRIGRLEDSLRKRIHFYNMAAGSTSNRTVPFAGLGRTGDRILNDADGLSDEEKKRKGAVEVSTVRLDDIVEKTGSPVFILKVDVQGYEPDVFDGLERSLASQRVQFILTEFWPRGMDMMAGINMASEECTGAHLLERLARAGYELYAMSVWAHPTTPKQYEEAIHERPLNDFKEHCQWYKRLEKRFPVPKWNTLGYWSDVLAVAPGWRWDEAVTDIGRLLK